MRDFTLDIYRELLETLQRKGYELISYREYLANSQKLKANSRLMLHAAEIWFTHPVTGESMHITAPAPFL